MPFLQLDDGEVAVLEIVSDEARVIWQHWLKGVAFDCVGDKCPFCAGGVRKSSRFILEVKRAGEPFTWGLSKRAYAMLMYVAGGASSLKGVFVELARVGTGIDTQWRINAAGGPPPPPEVKPVVAPGSQVETAHDEMVALLNEIELLQTMLQKVAPDRRILFEPQLAEAKKKYTELFGELPDELDPISF